MRVLILGKGELAIKICEWFSKSSDYELCSVVPVIPEPVWTESLSLWAKQNNIPLVESGHYKDLDLEEIDLAMSVFYDKCKRIINLHNSPLPKYRGISPINWALKDGCNEHGVTIHEITAGVDNGSIISQIKYSIYPEFEEVIDVYKKSLKFAYVLFENTISIIAQITTTNHSYFISLPSLI